MRERVYFEVFHYYFLHIIQSPLMILFELAINGMSLHDVPFAFLKFVIQKNICNKYKRDIFLINFLRKYCYWTLLKYFQFSLVWKYFGMGFKTFGTLFCLWVGFMMFCYEVMVGVDFIQNCFLPPTNNITYPFKSTSNIHNMWFYSFKILYRLYSHIFIITITISLFIRFCIILNNQNLWSIFIIQLEKHNNFE
jgi:hypothetical protein